MTSHTPPKPHQQPPRPAPASPKAAQPKPGQSQESPALGPPRAGPLSRPPTAPSAAPRLGAAVMPRAAAQEIPALTPAQAEHLARLIDDIHAHHTAMAAVVDRTRAALACADTARMAACDAEQAAAHRALGQLESRRLVFMRSLGLSGPAAAGVTLGALAQRSPEPWRTRLGLASQRARASVRTVLDRQAAVRAASAALVAHMQGLFQQVSQRIGGSQAYGPRGAAVARSSPAAAIDLTT